MSETTIRVDDSLTAEYTLDFIERQLFHQYDEAYRELTIDELPREQEVRAYEDALDAITHIRNQIRDTRTERVTETVEALDKVSTQ